MVYLYSSCLPPSPIQSPKLHTKNRKKLQPDAVSLLSRWSHYTENEGYTSLVNIFISHGVCLLHCDYLTDCGEGRENFLFSRCLSRRIFSYLQACLPISRTIYLSIYLMDYLSIHLSHGLSIYPSISRTIYLSIYLMDYLSIYRSIFLPRVGITLALTPSAAMRRA